MKAFILSNALVAIDPLNKFGHIPEDDFLEHLGLLPHWVNMRDRRKCFDEQLEDRYGFPVTWQREGTINEDLSYDYPGDPTLYPLGYITRGEGEDKETVIFYEYGLVGHTIGDWESKVGRMD